MALLAGTVEAVGRPAAMALPARLVEPNDLLTANAMIGAAEQSAIVFGPLVGSAAIAVWGIRAAFLIDAATFVIAALTVASLRVPPVDHAPQAHRTGGGPGRAAWRDMRAVSATGAVVGSAAAAVGVGGWWAAARRDRPGRPDVDLVHGEGTAVVG